MTDEFLIGEELISDEVVAISELVKNSHDADATVVTVKFTNVKGYDMAEYRQGELAVILARYDGDKVAKAGYDAVLLRNWF